MIATLSFVPQGTNTTLSPSSFHIFSTSLNLHILIFCFSIRAHAFTKGPSSLVKSFTLKLPSPDPRITRSLDLNTDLHHFRVSMRLFRKCSRRQTCLRSRKEGESRKSAYPGRLISSPASEPTCTYCTVPFGSRLFSRCTAGAP